MWLETRNTGHILHAQRWNALPSVGSLSRNLKCLGDDGQHAILAQAADRRINARHEVTLVFEICGAGDLSFDRLTSNVKQKWKDDR